MKTRLLSPALLTATIILTGCNTTDSRVTSVNQPGPAIGQAVGTVAGAVSSNVVGVGVGVVEGATAATKATFTNERRVIRTWREEKTADGRTIRVPVETVVDEHGRPVSAGN
jgi:hypothetical protein